jgi:outer membrane protein OmpA-like peptidoglycan-associated protein
MKATLVAAALLAAILAPGVASAQSSPTGTLKGFLQQAGAIMREAADPRQAWAELHELAGHLFDGRPAAHRTLGAAWEQMTGAERAEAAGTLGAVLAHAYLELARALLPRDRAPDIRILGEKPAPDGVTTVRTGVHGRDGNDIGLDYLMDRTAGRWRVRDVVIDGVSMVENYRAQFARAVRTSSYADALARLRRLAALGTAEPGAPAPEIVAYFATGAAGLSASAREDLDRMAAWLVANGQARVRVEGYADDRGEAARNEALAGRRAAAVREHLSRQGVDSQRISVVHGDREPACLEQSEACWALNRRVTVRLEP